MDVFFGQELGLQIGEVGWATEFNLFYLKIKYLTKLSGLLH